MHKKNEKTLPNNYRPISLLSTIGEAMERCVQEHIYIFVIDNNLITPLQSGFTCNDSTTNQILYLYHSLCEAVNSGKKVRVVFLDICKVFDRVWNRSLLFKLSSVGIKGNVAMVRDL